eukprot:s871_g14.t2
MHCRQFEQLGAKESFRNGELQPSGKFMDMPCRCHTWCPNLERQRQGLLMATEKVCENKSIFTVFTDRIPIDVDGVSEYSGHSRAPSAKVERLQ